jgi:hypothetical protein
LLTSRIAVWRAFGKWIFPPANGQFILLCGKRRRVRKAALFLAV